MARLTDIEVMSSRKWGNFFYCLISRERIIPHRTPPERHYGVIRDQVTEVMCHGVSRDGSVYLTNVHE